MWGTHFGSEQRSCRVLACTLAWGHCSTVACTQSCSQCRELAKEDERIEYQIMEIIKIIKNTYNWRLGNLNCLTISSVIGNLFTFSLWNFLGLLNSPTLHIALFHLHAKLLALLSLGEDFIIPSLNSMYQKLVIDPTLKLT